jgi:nitrite reductase/ring-hydroxylating ferredoxin subunit
MSDLNRREFVTAAALAAAACLCGAALPSTALAAGATLDIGTKADYTKDGVTDTWIKSNKVVVVRKGGKVYAFTAICSHRGATIGVSGDHFECPRHHAQFSLDGSVMRGPAGVSLDHFAISPDANGHLIVDTSRTFGDGHWNDPASFVKVDDN